MKIGEIGEFGLIEKLASLLPPDPPELLIGIGDDAAAWWSASGIQIATTDALIENVHFKLGLATWYDLGWKSLAVNLSDIAAMGGIARHALITLCLPKETPVEDVCDLYRGLSELAIRSGTAIAGGDTVSSPLGVVISVSVLGESPPGACLPGESARLLRRSASRAGDLVGVTGHLGASAAGLQMLLKGLPFDREVAEILRAAHLRPLPRLAEGRALLATGVRAAMDISDGLVGDLAKMCLASGVGARLWVDEIPIHPAVRSSFEALALELALHGGEDYELLFTAPPAVMQEAARALSSPPLATSTVIGEIVEGQPGEVLLVGADGKERKPAKGGYDHFAG